MIEIKGFRNHGDYIEINEYWWCKLDDGIYRVNGENKIRHYNGYNRSKNFIVNKGSAIEKVTEFSKELAYYESGDGEVKSIEDVNSVSNKYRDEGYLDSYPDLETEYEHKKELLALEKYLPVYNQKEDENTLVELNCVGTAEDTGSDFITTALCQGQASFSNSGFYKVDLSRIVANELMKFVLDNDLQDKFENSSHSNVHYAKINNTYMMTGFEESRENKFRYSTSLTSAVGVESDLRKCIKTHLNVKVFGDDVLLNENSLKQVVGKIEGFKRTLSEIQSKQKTDVKHRNLVTSMNKYIDEIKEFYTEGL